MAAEERAVRPDYGNWVSWKLLSALGTAAIILFALSFLLFYLLIGAIVVLAVLVIFAYERYLFSPLGSNAQVKLWDLLVDHLDWDGNGWAIDIGCGSGPVAIRVAKKYPNAKVVGLDYWGKVWEHSKTKCERNARIEKVDGRISFQKGNAAKIPFEDGFFDAAAGHKSPWYRRPAKKPIGVPSRSGFESWPFPTYLVMNPTGHFMVSFGKNEERRSRRTHPSATGGESMGMATFLMITKHAPDKCPMYNETAKRAWAKLFASQGEKQTKYGVKIIGGWTVHGEHQTFGVFDAPSLEALHAYMLDPDVLAVNASDIIEVKMVMGMEEVAKMLQLTK